MAKDGKRPNQVTISPDADILQWIDDNSGVGKRFYNRTHAFEYAASKLRETRIPDTSP